jgi:2-keto-4-pentenoate hydratase
MSQPDVPAGATSDEISIAEQFVRARLDARSLSHYPGTIPADIPAAYRCQDVAIARWPESIGGWKVTERLSAELEAQCGDQRLVGPAFKSNIRTAAAGQVVECPVFGNGFAAVEPEIVVRVGREAPADKFLWTLEEAAEMVGELCIGAEVASSPLPSLLQLGAAAIASDFGANFGIVVGSLVPEWRMLDEVAAQVFVEGKFVARGVTSLRSNTLSALAFTLGKCARRGRPLQAGAVITTGTITTFHPVKPGQSAQLVFEGLGEVRCRAVQAKPRSQ